MKRTIESADKNSRIDQRAWIGVMKVEFYHDKDKKYLTNVRPHFMNTGKSPAKNVDVAFVSEFISANEKPDFTKEEKMMPESKGILMQNQIGSDISPPLIHEGKFIPVSEINSGNRYLCIHGIIKYDDIYNIHHWYTFCAYANINLDGYIPCKEHNDTDNN
jgi:hypothetical protein